MPLTGNERTEPTIDLNHISAEPLDVSKLAASRDPGAHYRWWYKDIQLDPARIAKIYGITSGMQFTILKKVLCPGDRGSKDYRQDMLDIISAAQRELAMMDEDDE